MGKTGELFEELITIVAQLRNPNGGCPWDLKQTHQSLKPYLIEESYEVLDAIDSFENTKTELPKELGDVLLQVALHSQIAKDNKHFTIDDVVASLTKKLVSRHPHVFGDQKANNAQEAVNTWEKMKAKEKDSSQSMLDGVPKSLPALLKSHRLGEKVARVKFDWESSAEVRDKVNEELKEFLAESPGSNVNADKVEEELGDLLFTLAQLSRKLGFSAEDVLQRANAKFIRRFMAIESKAGAKISSLSREELEKLWAEVKVEEKM